MAAVSERQRQRAERFRFEHLRRAFLLAHGCLRTLLARYLGRDWAEIRFEYGEWGKPCVCSPGTDLRFNQSDSIDMAAFAFAVGLTGGKWASI